MITVYDKFQWFFSAGGPVLWLILLVTIVMWTFIIERFWFMARSHPKAVALTMTAWQQREDQQSWQAHMIRSALISQLALNLTQHLHIIRMLIVICPLLGLLGTVTGMMHIFDVITVLGTGNPRAISTGISMATIPTMAGLVAALSGYYFSIRLKHNAAIEKQRLADQMTISTVTSNV